MDADAERTLDAPGVDVRGSLRLVAFGRADPTSSRADVRVNKAFRSPAGPVTIEIEIIRDGAAHARAWGPGAAWAIARVEAIAGLLDDPSGFQPLHPVTRERHAKNPRTRLPRVPWVADALLHVILQQRVTFRDAAKSYRLLVREHGEPAPGPRGLSLPPPMALLARLPFDSFRRVGIDRQRAGTMRRAALVAHRLDALFEKPTAEARSLLAHIRGIGPWSTDMLLGFALGDPDAVPVGDLHLPHRVTWALAGEAPGTDERMLELLEPYRPHRFRVVKLLMLPP